jgi:glycosyltransferase involved in cell wall biosynthesis
VISSISHVRALRGQGLSLPYPVIAYPPRLLHWRHQGRWWAPPLLRAFHGWLERRYGIDIWHATVGFPLGAAVIAYCRSANAPHLVRCVGDDIQVKADIGYGMRLDPRVDREVRQWLPLAQRLVAITDSVAEEYAALGISDRKIARIPNGVDLARFRDHRPERDLRQELGISSDAVVFLALGRYHPKKNFEQVIAAARLLRKRTTQPFAVIIAGTGTEVLRREIANSGIGGFVFVHQPSPVAGSISAVRLPDDEILDLYACADVFIMSSTIETFGIVTVEAMASGLPVIAAESPGSRDVIGNGKHGLAYDGTTPGLERKMATMLDASTRGAWKDEAIRRAADFDWSEIVDDYICLYRELIAETELRRV